MQAQLPFRGFDVVANNAGLVRWKAIENHTHGFLTAMHQPAQQLDEQFPVQTTRVCAEPELAARTHRRGRGDRLPLPRSIHDWSLATQSPGLAMNGVGAKARFIPKQNLRAVAFGLAGQRRISLLLPQRNCLRISLIRALQRFLRSQLQLRQQRTHRRDSQVHAEFLLNQQRDDRACPQAKIQSVLPRIATVDPSKYLPLLGGRQASRTTRGTLRTQRSQSVAAALGHAHPFIDGRAVESVRGNHNTRVLALAYPSDRHETNLLQRGVINCAAINLHCALYQQLRHRIPYYSTNLVTSEQVPSVSQRVSAFEIAARIWPAT